MVMAMMGMALWGGKATPRIGSTVLPGLAAVFLLVESCIAQLPWSRCDANGSPVSECDIFTPSAQSSSFLQTSRTFSDLDRGTRVLLSENTEGGANPPNNSTDALISTQNSPRQPGFRWGRALFESFVFLSIEQAYVVHDDYRWVVAENGIPFNHYWRDYKQSLSTWVHSGWDDGDPMLYSYVGHPIQGALTEFIQIQNDPRGEKLEFSNTRQYWHSRFKAFLWSAAYSTQWNIGPLSELTVEKYGTAVRQPWNLDGTWPCTKKPCVSGVGQVDLVMTPIGGFAWMLTEDLLDKEIARRVEGVTRNHFLIDLTRCALNPIRGGANILHGKRPWYRASRDAQQIYFLNQLKRQSSPVDLVSGGGH
jgi:hypothetical protein